MIDVSVVIPTCNRPDYLSRCLASLVREVAGDTTVEIIVADDGSVPVPAEKNKELCHHYGAVYCRDEQNHGMAVARNRGIARSKGKWVVFLDDDVTSDMGWYRALREAIGTCAAEVVGLEGRINPSGDGVWDREVQNLSGGACLTSHFAVRKSALDRCGLFDEGFELTGPYCEDHEFAVRLLRCGNIQFISTCSVTHAPRKVKLIRYVLTASRRCRALLLSDKYFYQKHPQEYHTFRFGTSFNDTYRAYRMRHVVDVLRRRSVRVVLRHPLQALTLLSAALIEQVVSWTLTGQLSGFGEVSEKSEGGNHKKLDQMKPSSYTTKTDR